MMAVNNLMIRLLSGSAKANAELSEEILDCIVGGQDELTKCIKVCVHVSAECENDEGGGDTSSSSNNSSSNNGGNGGNGGNTTSSKRKGK